MGTAKQAPDWRHRLSRLRDCGSACLSAMEAGGHFLIVTLPAAVARAVWLKYTGEDPVTTANALRRAEASNAAHVEFLSRLAESSEEIRQLVEAHEKDRVQRVMEGTYRSYDCKLPSLDWRYWWRRKLGFMPVQPCRICDTMFWAGMPRFGRRNGKWTTTWQGGWCDYCSDTCMKLDD